MKQLTLKEFNALSFEAYAWGVGITVDGDIIKYDTNLIWGDDETVIVAQSMPLSIDDAQDVLREIDAVSVERTAPWPVTDTYLDRMDLPDTVLMEPDRSIAVRIDGVAQIVEPVTHQPHLRVDWLTAPQIAAVEALLKGNDIDPRQYIDGNKWYLREFASEPVS